MEEDDDKLILAFLALVVAVTVWAIVVVWMITTVLPSFLRALVA